MHEAIEAVRGPQLHPALAGAAAADGVHDLVALPPERDHLEHDLGRVLEVAVDDHDRVAVGEVEPGRDRQLVAEVPGQEEELDPLVPTPQLAHHLAAAIGAAVVHQDELDLALDLARDRVQPAVELGKDLLLVLHRDHERDRRHGLRVIAEAAHTGQTVTGPSASTWSCHGRLERSVGMASRAAPWSVPTTIGKEAVANRRRLSLASTPGGAVRVAPPRGSSITGGAPPLRVTVRQSPLGGGAVESGWRVRPSAAAITLSAPRRPCSGADASSEGVYAGDPNLPAADRYGPA